MNRLAKEKSPYLLQHATNPVDWYPWGEEAFQKSRAENKPIFLSIGYSTCHWCHVMEEESFVNLEIAKMLNDHFVSIKVDREERPDVDHIYMQAVMALTGSGGWPMSVFLTPELKPFYGGTYFPPADKWGRPGFMTVLKAISEQWVSRHDALVQAGNEIAKAIQTVIPERLNRESRDPRQKHSGMTDSTFTKAFEDLSSKFDDSNGGFSEAPKFPQSHVLSFLLRYSLRAGGSDGRTALDMVTKTLDEMAKGGMYDQIGGGFHRYSTDSAWRVPHFEKMLYDQALLSKTYLEAFQLTKNPFYAEVSRDILNYVLTKTDPLGGFHSAEDADSASDPTRPHQKSEGAYYLWSIQEIEQALGRDAAAIVNFHFGVLPEGNAPEDPQGEFTGKNILYAAHSVDEAARKFKRSEQEISRLLEDSKHKLNEIRSKRSKPHLDDKVLADWNGLMISSLAFGSRVLGEPKFLTAAQRSANFILERMIAGGRLMHRYRDGEVSIPGFLEDYSFFILGFLDLYEASFDVRYLKEAKRLAAEMVRLFWDETSDGFFLTSSDAEALISRPKEFYDGAVPSGNSVAALCLLRLARMMESVSSPNVSVGDPRTRFPTKTFGNDIIEKIWGSILSQIAAYPSAFAQMLMALDFHLGPGREVVVAGKLDDPDMTEALRKIFSHFIPNKVVLYYPHSFLKQLASDGTVTVYVCVNQTCRLPSNLANLDKVLQND